MKRRGTREIHLLPEYGEGAGGTMRKLVVTLAVGLGLIVGCSKARNDETIMNDIKAGLFSDAQTKSANIDVVVKNGTATLVGEVPDENTRYEAFKIAKGTAGVVNVQDQMSFPQARGARAGKTAANAASAANAGSVSKSAREARREHESLPVRSLAGSANQSSYGASTQAQDSSQQQSAESQPAPVNNAPPAAPAAAPAPAPAAPAPPPVRQVGIPSGTPIHIQMIDGVDSATNHAGDLFRASLAFPIVVNGEPIVPTGTDVGGNGNNQITTTVAGPSEIVVAGDGNNHVSAAGAGDFIEVLGNGNNHIQDTGINDLVWLGGDGNNDIVNDGADSFTNILAGTGHNHVH